MKNYKFYQPCRPYHFLTTIFYFELFLQSPTSVTTHGIPHDIASPTTLGKASAWDGDINKSKAGIIFSILNN